ncbi:MAG: triose-phosphate isomerase [Candidatus Uhrbacteria bacterium]
MKKIIIANWKMFLSLKESVVLAKQITKLKTKNEIVVCPAFISLVEVKKTLGKAKKIGAQNVAWQAGGALTGEVSAGMLAEVGCQYVIIGHSERRIFANEGDLVIREKLKLAAAYGLTPILCVGETALERQTQQTKKVLKKQLAVLNNLSFKKLIVAYEPVWAIGTNQIPTVKEISLAHQLINETASPVAKKVSVVYGGSVDENNLKEILAVPEVAGVLVGRASTKVSFWKKCNF